jgi:hypothetical protein
MSNTKTEVVKASAMLDVARRIHKLRNPDALPAYKRALAKYERELAAGGHKEITTQVSRSLFLKAEVTGYNVIREDGQVEFVERPADPKFMVYDYSPYRREHFLGEVVSHAQTRGLLADSLYNRDIRHDRVTAYAEEMRAGRWRDLLSDPISVTADGQLLNGQHRIAAVMSVDWSEVDSDPSFLVVWGVEPHEAQFADGSRRTARDEKTIADKLIAGLASSTPQ